MSKQRPVETSFWRDAYTTALSPNSKLVFLYLLTNPDSTLCGIYQMPIDNIALDTGLTVKQVSAILKAFTCDNKVHYYNGYVILVNRIRHQWRSPKVKTGIEREMSRISRDIVDYASRISDKSTYSIDTISENALGYVKLSSVKLGSVELSKARPKNVEEVQKYLDEKGITVFTGEQFFDFYASKGWMVGKNQMVDWHKAVGTWVHKKKEEAHTDDSKNSDIVKKFYERKHDKKGIPG